MSQCDIIATITSFNLNKEKLMNKKLMVSVLAGAAAIFIGQVAFTMYQARGSV